MYLILDSHMDTYKEQVKTHRSLSFFEEEDFHVEGYPKCMQVKFAYKNGKMLDTDQMEIEGILNHKRAERIFCFCQCISETVQSGILLLKMQFI